MIKYYWDDFTPGWTYESAPRALSAADIVRFAPTGIILSGGPESVGAEGSPQINDALIAANVPVLGICRGMQVMAVAEGGTLHQHLPDIVGDEHHRQGRGNTNTTADVRRVRRASLGCKTVRTKGRAQ